MSRTHFYLMLPSNASMDIFPDNKTTGYCVSLLQNIDLEGDWELGLYSVSYPNSWHTLQNDPNKTHLYWVDTSGFWLAADVDYGHYETIEDLLKDVNKMLAKRVGSGNIAISYNTITGKTVVKLKTRYKLSVSLPLSTMFGFEAKEIILEKTTTESPNVADMSVISNIYTYCDILEPQIVGDTNAQLLKSIPVEGKFGDIIAKTYTNIHYVPVQTKLFEIVKILLRGDTGKPVPFERGKVVIHFISESTLISHED